MKENIPVSSASGTHCLGFDVGLSGKDFRREILEIFRGLGKLRIRALIMVFNHEGVFMRQSLVNI